MCACSRPEYCVQVDGPTGDVAPTSWTHRCVVRVTVVLAARVDWHANVCRYCHVLRATRKVCQCTRCRPHMLVSRGKPACNGRPVPWRCPSLCATVTLSLHILWLAEHRFHDRCWIHCCAQCAANPSVGGHVPPPVGQAVGPAECSTTRPVHISLNYDSSMAQRWCTSFFC